MTHHNEEAKNKKVSADIITPEQNITMGAGSDNNLLHPGTTAREKAAQDLYYQEKEQERQRNQAREIPGINEQMKNQFRNNEAQVLVQQRNEGQVKQESKDSNQKETKTVSEFEKELEREQEEEKNRATVNKNKRKD